MNVVEMPQETSTASGLCETPTVNTVRLKQHKFKTSIGLAISN